MLTRAEYTKHYLTDIKAALFCDVRLTERNQYPSYSYKPEVSAKSTNTWNYPVPIQIESVQQSEKATDFTQRAKAVEEPKELLEEVCARPAADEKDIHEKNQPQDSAEATPTTVTHKKYKFKVSPKTVQDIEHKNTSCHTSEADIAKEIYTSCDDDRSEDDIAIKELSAPCIIATEQVHADTQIPESSANEQNQIRFCRICGTTIPSDSIFCYKCGERVVRT